MRRVGTAFAANVREFAREPVNLAMVLVLPVAVIEMYAAAMATIPDLPFVTGNPVTTGRVLGALFSTAFLAGLVGLFQEISAQRADGRLTLCGFPRGHLLAARLLTVTAVAAVAGAVSLGVLARTTTPDSLAVAAGALLLAGLTYGLIGVLVGSLLPRELEGSLVMVFVADLDVGLSADLVGGDSALTNLVPLHHASALFRAGVTGGDVTGHVLPAVAYVLVLLVLAAGAYTRETTTGGVLA